MPGKKKVKKTKSGGSRPSQSFRDHPIVIPFSAYLDYTATASTTVQMYPAQFGRVLAEADAFELYRFTKLKFRLLPGGTAGHVVAAYVPGVTDTAPNTITTVGSIPQHAAIGATQTTPSPWVTLRRELQGYEPWYKTVAGTPDAAQEIQGNIFIATSAATSFAIEIVGVCEFRGPVPLTSTPAMRREAALTAEYNRIMKFLAWGANRPSKAVPPTSG